MPQTKDDNSDKEEEEAASFLLPSDYAEEMFTLLQEDGLKQINPNARINMNVFGESVLPETVGVHVDVKLAREKDQSLPHRVQLSQDVQDAVLKELQAKFNPVEDKNEFDAMLLVRVVLVSDGSSLGRRFTSGVGKAKVALAYCLQELSEGKVAMANLVYGATDCGPGQEDLSYWEYSSAVVRSLARSVANDLAEQVTTNIDDWITHKKEKEERLKNIETKLAEEDNLDSDDYAFAAENHILQ